MSSLCTSDQRICHTWMCVESAPGPLLQERVEITGSKGTVKFHHGSSRHCHHIQTAKLRSGGVSHIFKAKATAAPLAANRVWASYNQSQCELWAVPASGTFLSCKLLGPPCHTQMTLTAIYQHALYLEIEFQTHQYWTRVLILNLH